MPGQPARRGVHRPVHGQPAKAQLRVPRVRAARRAVPAPGACQGRGRHLCPVRTRASAARAGAPTANARHRDLPAGRVRHAGPRCQEGIRGALRHRQRLPPRQSAGLGARATAGQDAAGGAGAPQPRHCAKEQEQRRCRGGGALVPRLAGVLPQRWRRAAQQLPPRRAVVREPAVCRGHRRVRKDGLRLPRARTQRRRRLLRVARPCAAGKARSGRRASCAAAGRGRQRAALCRCLRGRLSCGSGADPCSRDALRHE